MNLRSGFNRIFVILVVGWALFCLFVYPVLMARQGTTHYEHDLAYCYDAYGPASTLPNNTELQSCRSHSEEEWRAGLFSGFGFTWDKGEYWSFPGYYRHMSWMLVVMIALPPLLVYLMIWGVAAIYSWVSAGFRSTSQT